jgi:hypothetical protein
MEINNMKIVTDIRDMDFLLTAPAVAIDIETQTTAPENHPASGIKKFGLSYVAPIIAIALSVGPDQPTAVFLDLEKYDNAQMEQLREFLIRVICRPVMIVGHNVLFDLRSIGGHFGFILPRCTQVWDTLPMTRRLLLIDKEASNPKLRKMGAEVFEFGLLPVSQKWGLVSENEERFLDFMKRQRGKIAELLVPEEHDSEMGSFSSFPEEDETDEDEDLTDAALEADNEIMPLQPLPADKKKIVTLQDLKPNDPIWEFCGGFAPNKYEEKNRLLLEKYVAYDAHLSFQIYQRQSAFVKAVAMTDAKNPIVPFPGVKIPAWPKLPQLVEKYTHQLRLSANFAIQGLTVDIPYLEQRIEETANATVRIAPELFETPDPTDPYPMFKEITSQLIWYAQVLDTVREGKKYSQPRGWANWEFIRLDPSLLADALLFEVEDDSERMLWAEWLVSLDPYEVTRHQVIKQAPSGRIAPRLDILRWIYQQCFSARPELEGMYLANLKYRWYIHYYKSTKKEAIIKMVNSKFWRPYYVFVIAGWPLFTHNQLLFNFDLGTKGFQKARDELERKGLEPDLQQLCIEREGFSVGKKSLDWIFKLIKDMTESGEIEYHPEYTASVPYLKPFQELLSSAALNKRLIEYHQHAMRDGKIHSILSPNTQTGRDTSTLPNLQNIDMKAMAGIFVAEEGCTFLELDISNAEINMSAMISGDSNLAEAVGGDDYHWYWAQIYWPKETREIIEAGDLARKKILRGKGKQATFAIPYGAGYKKLASLLQTDAATAKAIAARIEANFPFVSQKKRTLADGCQKRAYQLKYFPAYTMLWDGSRVMVDSIKGKIQTYTIWNYQLQGGVAIIIHNAMIEIEEMLERKGYKSRLVLNVHDSLILQVDNWEYYNTDVVQDVLKILCGQVPVTMLEATVPAVDFASETCPSNLFKWGKRHNQDYPLPTDEFINRWGRWKLSDWVDVSKFKSEKEWEAPTWKGPKHEGWTFESAKEELREKKAKAALYPDKNVVVEVVKPKEPIERKKGLPGELQDKLTDLLSDRTIWFEKNDGDTTTTPELTPDKFLVIAEAMAIRGTPEHLHSYLKQVAEVRDWLKAQADFFDDLLDGFNPTG